MVSTTSWPSHRFTIVFGGVVLVILLTFCVMYLCFFCLRPVSCVSNVASGCGLSILDCFFGYLWRLRSTQHIVFVWLRHLCLDFLLITLHILYTKQHLKIKVPDVAFISNSKEYRPTVDLEPLHTHFRVSCAHCWIPFYRLILESHVILYVFWLI